MKIASSDSKIVQQKERATFKSRIAMQFAN